jgi:glycosyltransferase involved in cell wall biosynthesis/GT2 family glycosyltransferase
VSLRPVDHADPGRPLRITAVFSHPVIGGAELWLLSLLQEGQGMDVDAVVLAGDSPLHRLLEDRGIPVRSLPSGKRGADIAIAALGLVRLLRDDRPDILLCNGVKSAAVGVLAGRLAGVRSAWCKHDFVFDEHLGRVLARLADGVIASSEELLRGLKPVRSLIITPPVDLSPAGREESRAFWQRLGVDLGRPTVAMVCRIVHYKAIDVAIRALALPHGASWQLLVVGPTDFSSPDLPARLEALAHELGVEDRVVFTGPIDDVSHQLAGVDAVAVLTVDRPRSRYSYEGFGMVALESLVAGVPLIATERVPATALGPEGVLAVGPESADDVADALARALDLRPVAEQVGARLRQDYPTTKRLAGQLVDGLSAVACRPGAGATGGPRMSVVVTVLNEVDGISVLCDQLLGQLEPGDEAVIVDAGSTDGTREALQVLAVTHPALRVRVEPGATISEGRNAGVSAASNDVLAFTDAGCEIQAGWLHALRVAFTAEVPPALVTGVYRVAARGPWEQAFVASSYPSPEEAVHPGSVARAYGRFFGRAFDAVLCTGRSMAVSRGAWAAVGGFPEDLRTAEDVMFGRRVAAAGFRCVLTADAEVVWFQRSSVSSTARMYFGYGRGGGHSADPLLVGRDLARAAAYGFALWAAARRRPLPLALSAVGSLAYLSLPVQRAARGPAPWASMPLIPLTLFVKDVPKALGCLLGMVERWRGGSAALPGSGD